MLMYEEFRDKIQTTLQEATGPLTWTEIRTKANLPQKFPNNQWVHRMQHDIGLERNKDVHGIIHWQLRYTAKDAPDKSSETAERASKTTA